MECVVAEFETALLRYAARILNNPAAAEDVVQNVFVKLHKAWSDGLRPSGQLKAWLYRVTHNEAVDFIRRESRLHVLHEKQGEAMALADGNGQAGAASVEEKHALVLSMLHKLDARERQVVLLRLEEGLSYEDIADVTGRSTGNVGNILHHAVKKLSRNLQRAGLV